MHFMATFYSDLKLNFTCRLVEAFINDRGEPPGDDFVIKREIAELGHGSDEVLEKKK